MSSSEQTEQHKKAMLVALEKSLGIVTTACKNVGIGRTQYYQWLKDDAAFKTAVDEINEVSLDFGESQLHKLMKGYTLPETKVFIAEGEPVLVDIVKQFGPSDAAVIFFLKTKGKQRGYIPSKAIDVTTGGQRLTGIRLVDVGDDDGV